jgi:hypothetical protein
MNRSTMKLNLPMIAAFLGALAGIVGTVLTPIYGTHLTGEVQGVLQALSGLLLAIPVTYATHVQAHASKTRNAALIANAARTNDSTKIAGALSATVVSPVP